MQLISNMETFLVFSNYARQHAVVRMCSIPFGLLAYAARINIVYPRDNTCLERPYPPPLIDWGIFRVREVNNLKCDVDIANSSAILIIPGIWDNVNRLFKFGSSLLLYRKLFTARPFVAALLNVHGRQRWNYRIGRLFRRPNLHPELETPRIGCLSNELYRKRETKIVFRPRR